MYTYNTAMLQFWMLHHQCQKLNPFQFSPDIFKTGIRGDTMTHITIINSDFDVLINHVIVFKKGKNSGNVFIQK